MCFSQIVSKPDFVSDKFSFSYLHVMFTCNGKNMSNLNRQNERLDDFCQNDTIITQNVSRNN